ncbi:MAG TPA: hypothetical protein VGW38_23240, partial [Chloroflexota bacterium]|nr:hypothetical protein [Chloroflexota bacterium]
LRESIQQTLPRQDQRAMRLAYHGRIVDAVAMHDPAAARLAVAEHLRDTERLLRIHSAGEASTRAGGTLDPSERDAIRLIEGR